MQRRIWNPLVVGETVDSASAKGISDGAGVLQYQVTAELVREIKYVVQIELRLNEYVPFHVKLQTGSKMQLSVIGCGPRREAGQVCNACNRSCRGGTQA